MWFEQPSTARKRWACRTSPVCGIDVGHGVAGPVDEELLAGPVGLAHDHVDPADVGAVVLAEVGVAVAVGVIAAVLLPEELQGDVLVGAQLLVHLRPVGLARVGCARPWGR